MPALKNARHEEFCNLVVQGLTYSEAYRRSVAGKMGKKSPKELSQKALHTSASELLSSPKVETRIAEIRNKLAEKAEITVDSLCAELEQSRAAAHHDGQHAAAVSATMGKARITGLWAGDRPNHLTPIKDLTDEEVDREIARFQGVTGDKAPHGG